MNHHRYEEVSGELLRSAMSIEASKRPGYTLGSDDVLRNFKDTAARAGITPEQAWTVFFLKHVDAITAIMTRPELPVSEAALGRFSDALNYLRLGWALLSEREQQSGDVSSATTASSTTTLNTKDYVAW